MKINWINYKECPPAIGNSGETLYRSKIFPEDFYWGEITSDGVIFDLFMEDILGERFPDDITFYIDPADFLRFTPNEIDLFEKNAVGIRHSKRQQGIKNENRDSNKTE